MNTVSRAARRVGTTAGPAERALQATLYHNRDDRSRPSTLHQAADVLCLLAFFPLSTTARLGFVALFDRRLRRAYPGAER